MLNANTRKHLARKAALEGKIENWQNADYYKELPNRTFGGVSGKYTHGDSIYAAFHAENPTVLDDETPDAEAHWLVDNADRLSTNRRVAGASNAKNMKEVQKRIKHAEWKETHRHHGGT